MHSTGPQDQTRAANRFPNRITALLRGGSSCLAWLGLGAAASSGSTLNAGAAEPSLAEVFHPYFAIGMGVEGSPVSREVLLARLRAHIAAIAGHFRGRVVSWDVVNEALAGWSGEEYRQSEWWKVTFWNTHDGRSWLNYIPVRGRVDHPFLFDRQLRPKPAFDRVIEAARKHEGRR